MIKDLLGVISVKDQVITIDAIGCQTEIATIIAKGRGDYVLGLKGNQETLHEDVKLYFSDVELTDSIKASDFYKKTTEKAHGQIEIREYYQTNDISWLSNKKFWLGLQTIGMVKTTCKSEKGESCEMRYFISSLAPDIDLFSKAVRGHWSVESMHWHLDVTFREDKNRTLEKIAAENMNILRKLALSILKIFEMDKKHSLKKKRFAISCDFAGFADNLMAL